MSTDSGTAASGGGGFKGWVTVHRRGIAYGLVALACLLTLVVSLSVWVNRQLLDTNTWVDQSAKMLQNEQVRHALALRVVDAAYSKGDIENRLQQRLPDQLQGLAPTIAGALRPAAVSAAEDLLEQPRVQSLWEEANRVAHSKIVAILEGNEGGAVTTANGDVDLNVGQIVSQLREQLGITGAQRVDPEASITIAHSADLETAQNYVKLIKWISVFASIIVVALLALAIWLAAGSRREVVRVAAWGLLVVGLILLAVRRVAGNAVVDSISSPEGQPAARQVWVLSTSIMRDLGIALIAIGLLGLLWALVAGTTRIGTRLRNLIAPALRQRPAYVYGGVVVVFLLLLVWSPLGSVRGFVGTLALLVAALVGAEALRRQVLAEGGGTDDAPPPAPASPA
ncbi:MAG: hypothetical protein AB7O78_11555 [Thermoleophilia bacterium]